MAWRFSTNVRHCLKMFSVRLQLPTSNLFNIFAPDNRNFSENILIPRICHSHSCSRSVSSAKFIHAPAPTRCYIAFIYSTDYRSLLPNRLVNNAGADSCAAIITFNKSMFHCMYKTADSLLGNAIINSQLKIDRISKNNIYYCRSFVPLHFNLSGVVYLVLSIIYLA